MEGLHLHKFPHPHFTSDSGILNKAIKLADESDLLIVLYVRLLKSGTSSLLLFIGVRVQLENPALQFFFFPMTGSLLPPTPF